MAPTIAPTMAPRTLGAVDFVVIGVYVCICVGLGMWAGRKPQAHTLLRQHIRMLRCRRLCLYKEQILSLQASTNDYFLAERYTGAAERNADAHLSTRKELLADELE